MDLNETLSDEHGTIDESKLTPFQDYLLRKRDKRVHTQGRRDALLDLLRLKFSAVPQALEERVQVADEVAVGRWLARVLTAGTLDEVFSAG
jgi:hypothetical protein